MTTEKLNTEFINLIKEKLPVSANLANTLMDILFLGKEAIYRRLRGGGSFHIGRSRSRFAQTWRVARRTDRLQFSGQCAVQPEFHTTGRSYQDLQFDSGYLRKSVPQRKGRA